MRPKQHGQDRTSNIQQPRCRHPLDVRCWGLDVGCFPQIRGMIVSGMELIPLTIIPLIKLGFRVPIRVQYWRSRLTMNPFPCLVGTCSNTAPSFWSEVWERGGTRPYQIQKFKARKWSAGLPTRRVGLRAGDAHSHTASSRRRLQFAFAPHKRAGAGRASAVAHFMHVRHSNVRESMAIFISPPLS